jgi:diguanylate cyclase (GGDEF)-like protein/PAS domain S-box-containing protein
MTAPLPRHRRFLTEWLFVLAALLALGAYIGFSQYQEHQRIGRQQQERLSSQAELIEKNLVPELSAANRILEGMLEDLPDWMKHPNGIHEVNKRLQRISSGLTGVSLLLVISPEGRVMATNVEALLGFDVSKRDYFQAAQTPHDPKTLLVSAPFSSALGQASISLVRNRQDVKGEFGGVVLAVLNPDFFAVLLDSVRYTPDVETYLAHGDGKLFMGVPVRKEMTGQDLNGPDSTFSLHRRSGQRSSVFTGVPSPKGGQRLIAFRTIQPDSLAMDTPLVLTISRDLEIIYADWRRETWLHAQLFALLALVACVSLYLFQRRQRVFNEQARQREQALQISEARLQSFFDATPDALLISDANGIITLANQQVQSLLGFTVEELIGQSIESLVPERFQARHPALRASYATTPTPRRMGVGLAVKARRKDGTECRVEVSLSRVKTAEGMFFACALRDITARIQAEEQLRIAAAAFESHEGVVVTDAAGVILRVNRAFSQMTGYGMQDVINKKMNFLRSDHHDAGFYTALWQAVLSRGTWQGEIWNRQKNGAVSPYWLTISAVTGAEGAITHYVGTYTDITLRKQAEADLRIAATAFESQEGMIITDAKGSILRVNRAFCEISGYSAEEVIGQNPSLMQSGRHPADFYQAMWKNIHLTGGWQGEIWDRRKNGELFPKWLTISAVKDDDGMVSHYVGTHFDITEQKKKEEKIKELAFFDQLTGLPNRTLLLDRLKQAMTNSARNANLGALLFLDLDNFKTLNDTLGHDMGDLLLKQVAQRLTACLREGDTVARQGGDEFVVVLTDLSLDEAEAAIATEMVAEKILASLSHPYYLGEMTHNSSTSIGVTLFRGQQTSFEELLKQADLAMYKSKDSGRNAVHFFNPTMEIAVKKRVAMEDDLRRALAESQFVLHFQGQVQGNTRLTGAEVLVRWQHPERGMVSPAEFIPLAEETGLILPLGRWILETACTQLAAWACRPEMAHLTLAVNVSARQFNAPDFVSQVLVQLERTGVNPTRLKLELTESLLLHNVQEIIEKMNTLKNQGVGFSLDDFGTGYSSLSYLKLLPLDQLKIDQSFVRDVLTDQNDAAIARTIVALANSLSLEVIAEGVETQEQCDFLKQAGCHAYQGYFFSRPLPIDSFDTFAMKVLSSNINREISQVRISS